MASSNGIRVSIGRQRIIRTILSSYIWPIGYVVVDCEERKGRVGLKFWWGKE